MNQPQVNSRNWSPQTPIGDERVGVSSAPTLCHGFTIERTVYVAEIEAQATLYRHQKSGALLLSVEKSDDNKTFGVAIRTPPPSSNGCAHIIEHSVLAGSESYPVKDPFLELMKSSMQTYLNATTGADVTRFPVASQNPKDFENLVRVYLDSVYRPLLSEHTFKREGWHINCPSPDSALTYSGVVFNEMKDKYSTPNRRYSYHLNRELFPDTAYRYDSGGYPPEIPNLTYDQFRDYWQNYYHPSNSLLYFYGDTPVEERLKLADDYLQRYDAASIDASIPRQKVFSHPRRAVASYPVDQESPLHNKSWITVSWLVCDTSDRVRDLSFDILNNALLGTTGSPLYRKLLESGIGQEVHDSGVYTIGDNLVFSVGLKGVSPSDTDAVEKLVLESLQEIARCGLDPELIEGPLNQCDYALRMRDTSAHRGLKIFSSSSSHWVRHQDPIDCLSYKSVLAEVKEKLQDPRYLSNLIDELLLKNPHRLTLTLNPDPELAEIERLAETHRLTALKNQLTPEELDRLVSDTHELALVEQTPDTPEALATVPKLRRSDISRSTRELPLDTYEIAGCTTLHHPIFTNQIASCDLCFDLRLVPSRLLPYAQLFGLALTEMGTDRQDFSDFARRIQRETGHVYSSLSLTNTLQSSEPLAHVRLSGTIFAEQSERLFSIMGESLLSADFSNQRRFAEILQQHRAAHERNLLRSGQASAMSRLARSCNALGAMSDQLTGLGYLSFLRSLENRVHNDWLSVQDDLEHLRLLVLNRDSLTPSVTCSHTDWKFVRPELEAFLTRLPSRGRGVAADRKLYLPSPQPIAVGLTAEFQVNFVAKALNLNALGYQYSGAMAVAERILDTDYLWKEIRSKGKAYGADCSFNQFTGDFSAVSWSDPNIASTLATYDQSGRFLKSLSMSELELEQYVISTIGNYDGPRSPEQLAGLTLAAYFRGVTHDRRQRIREQILDVTLDDIRAIGDYLEHFSTEGKICVVGSRAALDAAAQELQLPFTYERLGQ